MPIAWGYVRVSDELQLGRRTLERGKVVDDTSLATQKRMILKWWDDNKHLFPDHTFATDAHGNPAFWEDPAQSARHVPLAQRPQGSQMLAALGQGDIIIVWEMSRVFRHTSDYLNTMTRLKALDVTFEPLRGPKPRWNSAADRFSGTVLAAVNELEADNTSERCRDVYHSRERIGRVAGPGIPLGYKRSYKLDNQTGKVMRFFEPCARERGWLLIFKHMRECGMTRDQFNRLRTRIQLRRGPKGKQRYWLWSEFNLAAYVIERDYPLQILIRHDHSYRRDRISAEVVPVRPRSARASQPKRKPAAPVSAYELWNAPAGSTVSKLRRQQYPKPKPQGPEAASQPPSASPTPSDSDSASGQTS